MVAELRSDAPFRLTQTIPREIGWDGAGALCIAMEATPDDDPADDLRGVEVVSTALLIFEHDRPRRSECP